jgi:hypothetical protein
MSRRFILILVMGLFIAVGTPPSGLAKNAKEAKEQDTCSPKVKYVIGHVYLFQKDPDTWERVPDGAWGKMQHKLWYDKFYFVFNGHGLIPGESYTLIYYPDPWPGNGLISLGTGFANEGGNVHIRGMLEDICDLPADYDANYEYGAKIWLVLSSDVYPGGSGIDIPKMIGWNPDLYLFEYNLIRFDNTNCEYGIVSDQEVLSEEPEEELLSIEIEETDTKTKSKKKPNDDKWLK